MTDEADLQTLVNVLKERPDLLIKLNRAIGEVLEASGVDAEDLSLEQVLEMAASLYAEPAPQGRDTTKKSRDELP